LAVLRLITSSNFLERSIGKSPGLSPFKMVRRRGHCSDRESY
jgi:hypothetical protein